MLVCGCGDALLQSLAHSGHERSGASVSVEAFMSSSATEKIRCHRPSSGQRIESVREQTTFGTAVARLGHLEPGEFAATFKPRPPSSLCPGKVVARPSGDC